MLPIVNRDYFKTEADCELKFPVLQGELEIVLVQMQKIFGDCSLPMVCHKRTKINYKRIFWWYQLKHFFYLKRSWHFASFPCLSALFGFKFLLKS